MTAAINRYNFSDKRVAQAISFLKGTAKTEPSFLKKFKGELKKGKLYLDGKLVVPDSKVEAYLRNRIYHGKTPLSRDAAFYFISKTAINVSRKKIEQFLSKQGVIRETDNQQATSKRGSRKVTKKGQLHYDLIEIKFRDLPFKVDEIPSALKDKPHEGEDDELTKGYIFSMTDALTSLAFFRFHGHKTQSEVTPIAREAFEWFKEKLKLPSFKSIVAYSDKGSEFAWKTYNSWGVRTVLLKRSSVAENKNSFFQRVLYKLAKLKKTTNLHKLVKDTMLVVNRTQSSLTKKAPLENIEEEQTALSKKYNKRRGKDSGIKIRRRALTTSDKVRIQLLGDKDKGVGFKAYHGNLWSKRNYKVQAKKGNRYQVNGKMYHRDQLRLTPDSDKKSEELLEQRHQANKAKAKIELAKIRTKLDAQQKSKRPAAKAAIKKLREQMDFWRKFDEEWGT